MIKVQDESRDRLSMSLFWASKATQQDAVKAQNNTAHVQHGSPIVPPPILPDPLRARAAPRYSEHRRQGGSWMPGWSKARAGETEGGCGEGAGEVVSAAAMR